jgi:hypothetical protein
VTSDVRSAPAAASSPLPQLVRVLSLPAVIPLACLQIAFIRRVPAWDPPSLWLDDLWMALAIRHLDLAQNIGLHVPSPVGFVVLARWAAGLGTDAEWPLQVVPCLFGLLSIPAFYWLLRRVCSSSIAIALGSLLATCHPAVELYALRVKHYTLDVCACIALTAAMVGALRQRRFARFALLVAVGLACGLFSFASLFISLCFVHVLLLERGRQLRAAGTRIVRGLWPYLAATLLFDLGVLALERTLLAGQSSATMKWFWTTYFLHFDTLGTPFLWFARRLLALPFYALSPFLVVLVPFVWIGGRTLWRDSVLRPLVWSALALLTGLIMAAALDIYPVGAERTGLFCYPLFWLFAAVGCEYVLRNPPLRAAARGGLIALAFYTVGVLLLRPRVEYSDARDRQVVEDTLRLRRPGDGLLMHHFGLLPFAYYGGRPLHFVPSTAVCHNFEPWADWPDLLVLPIAVGDVQLRADPAMVDAQLREYYRRGLPRIFYVATHASDKVDQHVVQQAERAGYSSLRIDRSAKARLFVFSRHALAAN